VKEVPVANDDPIDFIDAPHSELERTIEELVERAQLVLRTQGRLRHLLEANRVVVEELDIEQVLRRIAEAAVALVDAQYGALGVVSGDGSLERFIHVGIPDDAAAVIGHLPEGHGLLGAVIDTGRPIRLEHLDDDDRSVGFPAHHPHMDSFLGVPIRVRGEVFGNLYLTNRSGGPFSTEDQELVAALAATAGIAIENARLFDETRRRQRWSAALAEVTASLLSGSASNVLAVVAERVASVIDAELVCVVVADNDDGYLRVDTARGVHADKVEGMRFAAAGTLAGAAMDSGQLAVVDSAVDEQPFSALGSLGPTVALPLLVSGEAIGVLSVARAPGAARFASSDLDMASEFATQAGVAIELTRARADRERLGLIEERGRIARDLHDHVIQRLFGSGLALQSIAAANPTLADRVETEVRAIDAAINEIRTAVFALSARSGSSTAVRHRILDVVAEVTPLLASPPRLALSGPIDLLVTGALADDLVAVVREGLTNVARHARAMVCELEIDVTDAAVRVQILDDGVGIAVTPDRSSGTANLAERAALRGGEFTVTARDDAGTQLVWSAPIDAIGGDK
jgi:signal transduction histidine kinase